jgi:tetratricopeptide (TPR) repeat protein
MKSVTAVRAIFIGALSFCAASALNAQSAALLQAQNDAFNSSRAAFAAHNYDAAEAALLANNVSPKNTPHWEREAGSVLTRMAFSFHMDGDSDATGAIAKRALAHFKKAEAGFGSDIDPAEIADECEQAGYLCENLLGDRAAAKLCYQKAVKLSPKTGHAAELLDMLLRTEAEEAKKKAYVPEN